MIKQYTHELTDFFDLYREACTWFSLLGFKWAETRYGIYENIFENFISIAESGNRSSFSIENKRAFDNAYLEANEIIRVYTDLQGTNTNQFLEQLEKVLSGQEVRGLVDNDQARDFLFELSTASRFLRANYEVVLSSICDVVVTLPESKLYIECKRIKSPTNIVKNVKKATKQIKKRMGKATSKKSLGLVALNVKDLIVFPSNLAPDSMNSATELNRTLANTFLSNHLEQLTPKSSSKRLLGAMIECSSMWYLSGRSPISGLSYTRHTNFISLEKPEILEVLIPKICNQDII